MTSIRRSATAFAALFALSGCAAAGASLDRMAEGIDARSTCHTSAGEYVPNPGCTISYSGIVSSSTTTTTTTTTTTAGAQPLVDDD